MTHQIESLIDPKKLNKDFICQLMNKDKQKDIFVVYDEMMDTAIISFKDPEKIDTATYNVSEKLAYVVDIENLDIVGFWFIRFSKYWLETPEFKVLKANWNIATEHGLFSDYQKISTSEHKRDFIFRNKKNRPRTSDANLFIQDIFSLDEIKEEFCPA